MDNQDQIEFWNGDAGRRWVVQSDHLDAMLLPFAEAVLEAAAIDADEDVMDIGCGAGALSLMAAKKARSVLGLDVSKPLIDLATKRCQPGLSHVHFSVADASSTPLSKKRHVMISRFGVMFFQDPAAAFANIRANMLPRGRLVFACWQSPAANGWARTPLDIAAPFLKEMPAPPPPGTPGPFAFASPDVITKMLAQSGWTDAAVKDWSGPIKLPGRTPQETADFMLEMGPLSRLLKAQNLEMAPIREALTDHLKTIAAPNGTTHLGAGAWIVSAKAG